MLSRHRKEGIGDLCRIVLTSLISALLVFASFVFILCSDESDAYSDSGTCGSSLTWTFDNSSKQLTISGTGGMYNYDAFSYDRWGGHYDINSVVINEGVMSIGTYAFSYIISITSVEIPDSVHAIGDCAFSGCTILTSIEIPENIIYLGYGVFSGCLSLNSVKLPSSLTYIGGSWFYNCCRLESISIPQNVTTIESSAFYGAGFTTISIPQNVTSIGWEAFKNCSRLVSIDIPNSVTAIGESVFENCTSLETVTMGDNVITIGSKAFYGCNSLTSITIPKSVITIGDYAFFGCSKLKTIPVIDNELSLGKSTFSNCSSLSTVSMISGKVTIDRDTFNGCDMDDPANGKGLKISDNDNKYSVLLSTRCFDYGTPGLIEASFEKKIIDDVTTSDNLKNKFKESDVFVIVVKVDSKSVFYQNGVTVVVPYDLETEKNPDNLVVYSITNNMANKVNCNYNNGQLTISSNSSNGTFVINYEEPSSGNDNTWLIIGGVAAAIIGIGVAIFIIRRR